MNKLYPLKFKPIFKQKIWGGQQIKTTLKMDFGELPNCGEVWVVSGVEGNQSVVENGFLAGNQLNELVEVFMGDLVGDVVYHEYGDEFPLLIKYIDADDWLSIQVHPDDELAARRNIGNGKTEMWYILDSKPGAQLISGFNTPLDKDTYLHHLENGTLKSIMHYENAKKGDVFFMPAGRIHAIGPGILLAEIQQTSDNTYRIYDWDRVDKEGNPRELHTEAALDAIDFSLVSQAKTNYEMLDNRSTEIVDNPKFTTNLINLDKPMGKDYQELDSFVLLMGIEGHVILEWEDGKLPIKPGDAVLKPSVTDQVGLFPEKASKLLEVYIKVNRNEKSIIIE
ncbi:MAG: mannose-6-phosphate isomerase [bacterium]|jgi:mannose-6-phosphate isomerase